MTGHFDGKPLSAAFSMGSPADLAGASSAGRSDLAPANDDVSLGIKLTLMSGVAFGVCLAAATLWDLLKVVLH